MIYFLFKTSLFHQRTDTQCKKIFFKKKFGSRCFEKILLFK